MLGNKLDLGGLGDPVGRAAPEDFAQANNIIFFETSAKNGDNVNESIEAAVKQCLKAKNEIKPLPEIDISPHFQI